MTADEALRWVRNEIVELCSATADNAVLRASAEGDAETKQGAYSRGRIRDCPVVQEDARLRAAPAAHTGRQEGESADQGEGKAMTKEELAAYEIKPISEIIPYWDELSGVSKAVIESAFNLEWWRGYHAPRPATMRHVKMGQPAPEGDTHIILGAEDYERWREECGKLREELRRTGNAQQ